MSNRVLIDIMDSNNHDAGTKARNDVTTILNSIGFKTTVMFNRTHGKIMRTLEMLHACSQIGNGVRDNDIIVLQYPYQIAVMNLFINRINKIKKKKKCKFVILIHDVVYLRNESYVGKSVEQMKKYEVSFFNSADAIIVHNSSMKKQLTSAGVRKPMIELGIFDYIYSGKSATKNNSDLNEIVFAGNLAKEKSGFIYKKFATNGIKLNLYGSNPDKLPSVFDYKGSFPPNELIQNIEGNYGLVWDGPSADSCTGNYGNYLKFNNPHKLSLYIAAELPVVVWSKSAVAKMVKENKIGFVINSLNELSKLPKSGSQEYNTVCENVRQLSNKVKQGFYLKSAIKDIKTKIKNKEI